MKLNLYLPDDLGKKAKALNLPLSRLLRVAVLQELARREDWNFHPHDLSRSTKDIKV